MMEQVRMSERGYYDRHEYDIRKYVEQLLGVDLEREVNALMTEVLRGSGELDTVKVGQIVTKLCRAELKLSYTTPKQLEVLGKFLGWIMDHWRGMEEADKLKNYVDALPLSPEEKEICKRNFNEIKNIYGRIVLRFVIDFLYWIYGLPSVDGDAFKRLTARTEIVHTFTGRSEEKERGVYPKLR